MNKVELHFSYNVVKVGEQPSFTYVSFKDFRTSKRSERGL